MKKEFKGTKGKWELDNEAPFFGNNNEYNGGFGVRSIDNHDIKIVDVPAYSFWGLTIEQSEANAKLIAAAPEMLEFLIEAQRIYEEKGTLLNANAGAIKQLLNKILD